jgi:hypothetical protein
MNRLHIWVIPAIVAASALTATTVIAGPPALFAKESAMATTDPEHARLAAMCGTWNVEMTFWFKPGAQGIATTATSSITAILGGLFVEERIQGALNAAPFTTLAWTGFNTETRQYEATRIASSNTARIAEAGSYDEKTRQFELKADYLLAGQMWHQRTVIQPTSPDAMVATSYLSFGTVPDWKAVEIKYTRSAK